MPVWVWPNVLSLDAPLIAVLWQDLLARSFGIPLRPAGRAALGLTVWAIYLADRLLDARERERPGEPARHRFYRRHPRVGAGLLVLALAADLVVGLAFLRPQVLDNGLFVFGGVCLYLVGLHAAPVRLRIPKEVLVALLFTVGTFLVALTNAASPLRLWPAAVTYFMMCLANLVLIEVWEWRELRGDKGNRVVLWLGRWLPVWTGGVVIFCVWAGVPRGWYLAVAVSVAATLGLWRVGPRLPLELRRTLVDVVLLSPLLFYYWRPV